MDVVAEIRTRLEKYPDARYVATRTSVEVQARDDSGFPVALLVTGTGFTVHFARWHEDFASRQEALNCFAFGLSPECRLRVEYRGRMPVKWSVESQRGDAWVLDSETGLIFVPFWRPRRVVFLQNRLLPPS